MSEAVVTHLDNFGTNFADRFLACFEPTSLSVYGEPSTQAKAALDGLGAAYLGRSFADQRYLPKARTDRDPDRS